MKATHKSECFKCGWHVEVEDVYEGIRLVQEHMRKEHGK